MQEKWIIFDTETDGLIANRLIPPEKQPHIIEFAYWQCILNDEIEDETVGEIVDKRSFLIKPPQPVSEEITKITGITNEILKDAPPFETFAEGIRSAFEWADIRCAHNLTFDEDVTTISFSRAGLSFPFPARQRRICSVEKTEHLFGYRPKLSGLYEFLFGKPFVGAHRAEADVAAAWDCIQELRKRGEI